MGLVARTRKGTQRHTVESVGERDHVPPPGDLACELERRLYGVRACRPGELCDVIKVPRLENRLEELVQEALLALAVQVQAVGYTVTADVIQQGFLQHRVVVPVIEGRASHEKIEIGRAIARKQA